MECMENTKLKLELEAISLAGPHIYEREIHFPMLIHQIIGFLDNSETLPRFLPLGDDFFRSLFEISKDAVPEQYPNGQPKLTPRVHIHSDGERWARITIDGYKPVFAFRRGPSSIGDLQVMPVPDRYDVDREGNIIGERLLFTPDDRHYPWMLRHPGRYDALGRLNYLLNSSDSNALTILTRSPQPYKGMGHQIIDQLKELKNLTVDMAGRPKWF